MWEIAFYLVGAAAAAVVALHLKRQFSGSGCVSCPYRENCAKNGRCHPACQPSDFGKKRESESPSKSTPIP